MKIILAGATGDVGLAVLKRCVETKGVSRITALTLNDVPSDLKKHPKVTILKQDDYTNISDYQMFQLRDAEACIWCIGGTASDYPDMETARTIQVEYPLAAAETFAQKLMAQHEGAHFRFVFCSAGMAERDSTKKLSFAAATRYLKVNDNPFFSLQRLLSSLILQDHFTPEPSRTLGLMLALGRGGEWTSGSFREVPRF